MVTTFLVQRDNGYRERLDVVSNSRDVMLEYGRLGHPFQRVVLTKAAATSKLRKDVRESTAHVVRIVGNQAVQLSEDWE